MKQQIEALMFRLKHINLTEEEAERIIEGLINSLCYDYSLEILMSSIERTIISERREASFEKIIHNK
jgi:hypothetical protein